MNNLTPADIESYMKAHLQDAPHQRCIVCRLWEQYWSIREPASALSDAWESDDVTPENTWRIWGLMADLKKVLEMQ